MIEINLLPEELRAKVRVTKNPEQVIVKSSKGFNQDKLFILAIPALLGIFTLIHLYFTVESISKNIQLGSLNKKWIQLEPQKKVLDDFNKEYSVVSGDAGFIQLLTSKRIFWAQKLNELSLDLPSGIWFSGIIINNKNITINGSVISLQKDEVALINKFLDNLKADSAFLKDFTGFELSNVQKKSIGGYDVADFVLIGVLKAK